MPPKFEVAQAPCTDKSLDFFFLAVRVYSAFFGAFFLLNLALVATWIVTVCLWRGKSQVRAARKFRLQHTRHRTSPLQKIPKRVAAP